MPLVEDPADGQQEGYIVGRTCWRGVFTLEEAQTKVGAEVTVIEVRPAQCVGEDVEGPLVAATEVLFLPVPYGGVA
jgi:hypothetical protein